MAGLGALPTPAVPGQATGASPLGSTPVNSANQAAGYTPGGYPPGSYPSGPYSSASYPPGPYSSGTTYAPGAPHAYTQYQAATKKKTPVGWWIGGGLAMLVIIVALVLVVSTLSGSGPLANPGGGQASTEVCPVESSTDTPEAHPNDGRVHGGPLSYPELGAPWGAPEPDTRVPFGSDVQSQLVTVEANYQPNANWVASILVGRLQAGDGFFTPQQGSEIVVKCIVGRFYGNARVTRDDKVSKATKVDGHDAWLVETHLSFDITGLRTKGELAIIEIVSVGVSAGLYYASIPDTVPELVAPARQVMAELKVDK